MSRGAIINRIALAVLLGALLAVPIVLLMFKASFWVNIITEILIWSLLAASVNLLLGYVGLLSFGQALYFGVGMYGAALSVLHWGAGFWGGLLLGALAATVMAAIAGSVAVRLTWHYFAIITVVFSLILYFAAMSAKPITGGDDGISFSAPSVFKFGGVNLSLADPMVQFYAVLAVVAAAYAAMWLIVKSPLGLRFQAVRENDRRARLIGINVYLTRYISFVIAGTLAGVSGALFAFFGRYASASYMFYHVSGEAVVWAIVGGVGSLLGPLFGPASSSFCASSSRPGGRTTCSRSAPSPSWSSCSPRAASPESGATSWTAGPRRPPPAMPAARAPAVPAGKDSARVS